MWYTKVTEVMLQNEVNHYINKFYNLSHTLERQSANVAYGFGLDLRSYQSCVDECYGW